MSTHDEIAQRILSRLDLHEFDATQLRDAFGNALNAAHAAGRKDGRRDGVEEAAGECNNYADEQRHVRDNPFGGITAPWVTSYIACAERLRDKIRALLEKEQSDDASE